MIKRKIDKKILESNDIIPRDNIILYMDSEIDKKIIKYINGFLYVVSQLNKKHLFNFKIHVKIPDNNRIVSSVSEKFDTNVDVSFDRLHIIADYFYITEFEGDQLRIKQILRKAKIKEIFEL
jgi:hypothetical protein